jgi:hypothetical protein
MNIYENLFYSENQLKHFGRDSEFLNFQSGGIYAHLTLNGKWRHWQFSYESNFYLFASNPNYTSANCEILEIYSLQRILEEAIKAHYCANVLSLIYNDWTTWNSCQDIRIQRLNPGRPKYEAGHSD